MSMEFNDAPWSVLIRSDEVGKERFKRQWDSFSDDELLDILEHLRIIEATGADPDNACAVVTESARVHTAYIERTPSSNCIIFLAAETATRNITILDVCKEIGVGTFTLSQQATREMRMALGLRNPAVEYL